MTFSSGSIKNSSQEQKPDHSESRNKGASEMSLSEGKGSGETIV